MATHLLLDDPGEELQDAAAHKGVDIVAMGLQGVQELVPGVPGCFLQLIPTQDLQHHLCHGCQHGIAHHVILRESEAVGGSAPPH